MENTAFRQSLNDLVNLKIKSPAVLVSYIVSKNLFFKKKAAYVQNRFSKYKESINTHGEIKTDINILPYVGNNCGALKMKNFLISHLKSDLTDVLVHGSIATNEEIEYSDFDGLVIIKNEVFDDPLRLARVAKKLSEARQMMTAHDPLQHHGWFLLAECELNNYDDTWLPAEVLKYSRSLLHQQPYSLAIYFSGDADYSGNFFSLSAAITRTLKEKHKIKNRYQLKSLFSRFMLLPSLYYQAKNKKGIFKKNSFAEVKKDFKAPEWSIMEEVSQLRSRWTTNCSPFQRKIISKYYFMAHQVIKPFYPGIPPAVLQNLNEKLYNKMISFTEIMEQKIKSLQ